MSVFVKPLAALGSMSVLPEVPDVAKWEDSLEVAAEAQFDALFRENFNRVVGVLTVRFGSQAAAEDAVAEAFADAWERWDRLRHYDKTLGWIYRIANQRIARSHHAQNREEDLMRLLSSITPDTREDVMAAVESRVLLTAALRGLPPRQVEILAFHYLAGYTSGEIAGIFGIRDETVRSHLSQGRKGLRRTLGDLWPQTGGGM